MGGSQGGCGRRIEVFVNIKKKIYFFLGGGGGGWVGLGGVRVDVNEELKFCENSKKNWGGQGGRRGGGGRGWVWGGGVRVDVIEEIKIQGGGVGLGGGGFALGGGGQGGCE